MNKRNIISILLLVLFASFLTFGCGVNKDKFEGTWSGIVENSAHFFREQETWNSIVRVKIEKNGDSSYLIKMDTLCIKGDIGGEGDHVVAHWVHSVNKKTYTATAKDNTLTVNGPEHLTYVFLEKDNTLMIPEGFGLSSAPISRDDDGKMYEKYKDDLAKEYIETNANDKYNRTYTVSDKVVER